MTGRRPRIFYGWWIVAATLFISLYIGGIIVYGFTAIFEPVANEFKWSYAQISLAASLRGLEMGVAAPLTGLLVDRWGPRKLILIGAIITGIGLLLFSYMTSLVMFYGAFFLVSLGMSGCTMNVPLTAVANWFRRKVGTASGIAVAGFGFGGLIIPLMVKLIEVYGWRETMIILGLGTLVMIVPLSFVFRHKPEEYGYLPDGEEDETTKSDAGSAASQIPDVQIGIKEALRSRTFWHVTLAFTYHSLTVNAIVVHVMPYLSSIGVTRSVSSLVATALPLTSIIGRLGFGWIGDRFDRKWVSAASVVLIGLGTFCFAYAQVDYLLLIPFFLVFGIGFGGSNTMRPAYIRELFGRASFGAVFGFVIGINMLGNFVGPLLAGWAFDTWGSYQGIWLAFAILGVAATLAIASTPRVKSV